MSKDQFEFDEIVICTKDRPDALSNALKSINLQTSLPNRILIVDSSSNSDTRNMINSHIITSNMNMKYIQSKPGLTFQRNRAIENLLSSTKIAHFIDDDVELLPDYLTEILSCFNRHPQALGVGGSIQNLPEHILRLRNRLFGLDSVTEGKVLRSGVNVLNFAGSSDRSVDWLSGCSMSFRKEIFSQVRFDERRTGNGTGEDVDFCLRIKNFGEIIWTPSAKLYHFQSPINRLNEEKNRVSGFKHRLLLANDGLGRVKKSAVFLSEGYTSFISIIKSIKARRLHIILREYRVWKNICGN